MALIWAGMPCALCKQPVDEGEDRVATPHLIESPFDVLWDLSDAVAHRACFVAWPHRLAFMARYNAHAGRMGARPAVPSDTDPSGRIAPDATPAASIEPPRVYRALALRSHESLPGLHVWFDPHEYPAPGARYLILLHLEGAASALWDAVADHACLGPVTTIRESVNTGTPPSMPLRRLAAPPADLLRVCPDAGHDRVCLETEGHPGLRRRAVYNAANNFALFLFGPLAQARPSFWAIRATGD